MAGSSASWGLAPLLNRTPHLMAIDGMTGMANIVVKVFAKRWTAGDKASFSNAMWPILVSKNLDTSGSGVNLCTLHNLPKSSVWFSEISRPFFSRWNGSYWKRSRKVSFSPVFWIPRRQGGKLLGVGRSVFHVGTPKHIGTWQNAKTLPA